MKLLTVALEYTKGKGKSNPYSITKHRVLELIPVLGRQPSGDVSHKPGGRLPLLSARLTTRLPSHPEDTVDDKLY